MSNNFVIFGGSSGLAKKTISFLKADNVISLSSKDCDVRNEEAVESYIKQGNIALYFSVVNYDNLIKNITPDELNHSLDVNIKGYLNVLKSAAKTWKDTGGTVIYISSILSSNPIKGTALYSSCKSFCDTATKVFSMENAKNNITANSIQLGYFDGGLTYKVPQKILDSVKETIPCKRFGNCDELATTINSIIENRYMTGSIIKLSGGLV
jgi:NAD(P)-dependent dehydrogenase (short-subunit alcohol dehydrogenase family)